MTPSELKEHVSNTGSHHFDRSSMKFFGDTMSNYGVRATVVEVHDNHYPPYHGGGPDHTVKVEVWELYRKRPVKHGLRDSAYFDKVSFKRVFPAR